MSVQRVAQAYAKSVVELAQEKNVLDKVYEDMQYVVKACESSRELRNLLSSPIISNHKKLAIVDEIFKGKVSDITFSFFSLITKKKREDLLFYIAKEFINEYNTIKGIQSAILITPIAVPDAIKKQVGEILGKISDKKYELINKIDPSIIGGFVLTTGDKQIDASVRNKLAKIKNQFSVNPYISKY